MVLLVHNGCIALNLRLQRIRAKLQQQREALAQALEVNRELATRDEVAVRQGQQRVDDALDATAELRPRAARHPRPVAFPSAC